MILLRRRRRTLVPAGWEAIAQRRLQEWSLLDDAEREHLGELVAHLLTTKHWEAARGFTLTDEVRVTIAASAALLILGLDIDHYRDVSAIIVHRGTVTTHGPRSGPAPGVMTDAPRALDGETHDGRGPVLLSWPAVRRDTAVPARGRNVVLHEMAHKLDMLDGLLDGTPLLADRAAHDRWVAVCTAAYDALRAGDEEISAVLRDYGAQDPGEFFAVATEAFFTRPRDLAAAAPEMYALLSDYFGQDPAARREPR